MPFLYQKTPMTFQFPFHCLCNMALNNLYDLKIFNFNGHFKSDLLVNFEVLTVAAMKTIIFWDVTSCDLVDIYVSEEHTAYMFSV
jgi:hypothetical protein